MKKWTKQLLHTFRIYHPLQSFYRSTLFKIKNNYYRYRYARFKGDGFSCNVCGASYKKFISDQPEPENREAIITNQVIAGYGKNIFCPNCMSTARDRLVLAFLEESDLQDKKILHLSPEKNIYKYISQYAVVTTADLHPEFYKPIHKNILKADATSLLFKDNDFDLVIANHIMEHIPDDKKAMHEIFRVLKPGGRAILQVPYSQNNRDTIETPEITDPLLQSKMYGQNDHVRIYNLEDYKARLQYTGFHVEIIPYTGLEDIYKYAIQENESFLVISKPIP